LWGGIESNAKKSSPGNQRRATHQSRAPSLHSSNKSTFREGAHFPARDDHMIEYPDVHQ
jgi:hypothetical protein